MTLRRKLGLSTVLAVVMGDMLGSGIFFTPGQLAAVVAAEWQVYAFWLLCGLITLCALVRRALKTSGVVLDLTTLEGATPVQRIALEPNGERRFVGYDVGVLDRFRPSAAQTAVIEAADWLVMPHYGQIAGLFDAVLRKPRRGALAVDFADFRAHGDFALLERSLEQIDVAFFGLQAGDACLLAEIERVAREHDRLLVATLGPAGSCAYAGARLYRQAAIPVPAVVDTTGAGDAFAAGFLSRHCHGAPVAASLAEGARLAAAAIQQMGGAA